MKIIYKIIRIFLVGMPFLIMGCSQNNTVCTQIPGTPDHVYDLSELLKSTPVPEKIMNPISVEIGGKPRIIDKLVDYPLCNDSWSGTVYVNCDAQVALAGFDEDENPLFLKDCDLNIALNTIVYVAAHNDTAYYKGCSCHTGEDPVP